MNHANDNSNHVTDIRVECIANRVLSIKNLMVIIGLIVDSNIVKNVTDSSRREHGHAKRGGGRVPGKSHIAPAEQAGIDQLEKDIERSLRHG